MNNKIRKNIGVLIINLGTPKNASVYEVSRFLREFLSDRRVIKLPKILWWFILNLIIIPFRSFSASKSYKSIWTDKGSPLLDISKKQVKAINNKIEYSVVLAMRYGNPSIKQALNTFKEHNIDELLVLPLYPQYSATTTASTFDAISSELGKWENIPNIIFISRYYYRTGYIDILKESIEEFWSNHGKADILLFSFHGIPQKYVDDGDTYYEECLETANLLSESLNLDDSQWELSFQSRLGRGRWLEPYTIDKLSKLAKLNKSVQVICPGFSVDCLETLAEIEIENKEKFIHSGGKKYQYIPCLNDTKKHIDFLTQLILEHTRKV